MERCQGHVKRELYVALAAVAIAGALFGFVGAGAAGASTLPTAFYLDIGGSDSIGYQPTPASAHGQRTDSGYANFLVAHEGARGVTLELDESGCAGETTSSMLTGGDSCYLPPDSQLLEAVMFLSAHQDESGLVTVDLGFNDLLRCFQGYRINAKCVDQRLQLVRAQLPQILTALKSVAGPDVIIVGVGHYDPYLADALQGGTGEAFADQSYGVVKRLDKVLADVYGANGIPVADVGAAFNIDNTSQVTLANVGTVPDNLAEVCLLTWMCPPTPYGPNMHPNDAGYEAIADSIAAQLPTPW